MVKTSRKLVFVGMSGGVDSSVAALLLKKMGYEVIGIFIRSWSNQDLVNCPWEKDSEDARRVAEKIGIPFYVWDFEKEYKKEVVDYMIETYKKGLTPNPDVLCNKQIKFGLFLDKAKNLGADFIATGHYIKKIKTPKGFKLIQAKDLSKDQSYFLWMLNFEQIKNSLFPIGDYPKSEVRQIAQKAGLPVYNKKDSQGICFLGKVRLFDFLKNFIKEKEGEVKTIDGRVVGRHRGVWFYTIGQRHIGVSAGGLGDKHNSKPFYVVDKDTQNNILIVAQGEDHPALYKKEIKIEKINFLSENHQNQFEKNKELKIYCRVRYRQPLFEAKLIKEKSDIKIIFNKSQKFVASGQSAVFYLPYKNNFELIGGGIIK